MAATVSADPTRGVEGYHQHDRFAGRQLGVPLAQLRLMLGAVQSPEPAQEDQHDGSPQKRGERDPLPGRARQGKLRCTIADTQHHSQLRLQEM